MDAETREYIKKKLEEKETPNLTIRRSVREVKLYCKKHGVFAYNEYTERHFINMLDKVIEDWKGKHGE